MRDTYKISNDCLYPVKGFLNKYEGYKLSRVSNAYPLPQVCLIVV